MDSLFKPVLDESEGTFTANQVQGIFGEFKPVIDDAQGGGAPPATPTPIGRFMTVNTGFWGS